jgi:hypothetical protein
MRYTKILALLIVSAAFAAGAGSARFSFYAIGNSPWFMPEDGPRFSRLIRAMENDGGRFVLHVGNITDGVGPLTDDAILRVRGLFQSAPLPLLYTPGENCWAVAHRPSMGARDPLERLAFLRKHFFAAGKFAFGAGDLAVTSQSGDSLYGEFVENTRFIHGGVLFTGLHVVGGNNNYSTIHGKPAVVEYERRELANVAWLNKSLQMAAAKEIGALVVFCEGNIFADARRAQPAGSGYSALFNALTKFALQTRKPILLVHGDGRSFVWDKPAYLQIKDFANNEPYLGDVSYGEQFYGRGALENISRVQVFGGENLQGLKITYDAGNVTGPFVVEQFIVPENTREVQFSAQNTAATRR